MILLVFLVEVTGLEPTTFWSLTRRATKLRYTSMKALLYYIDSVKSVKRFFTKRKKFLKFFFGKKFIEFFLTEQQLYVMMVQTDEVK